MVDIYLFRKEPRLACLLLRGKQNTYFSHRDRLGKMADDTANDASLSDNTVAGFLPDRTDAELGRDSVPGNSGDGQVKEKDGVVNWDDDPQNPYNWPAWKKTVQVVMLSSIALLA